jgi:hypothetical protein
MLFDILPSPCGYEDGALHILEPVRELARPLLDLRVSWRRGDEDELRDGRLEPFCFFDFLFKFIWCDFIV